MKRTYTLFALAVICSLSTYAQHALTALDMLKLKFPGATHEQCKSDVIHSGLMLTDSIYASAIRLNENKIKDFLRSPQSQLKSTGTYTIPVVVHVIHLGEAVGTGTNISDAQIQSAIDNLNDAYRNVGYNGVDVNVEFALAVRDPFCGSTNGINRVSGTSVSGYSSNGITDVNEVNVKALSRWPNDAYYNIWIVSEIDGNNGGGGTQGYAYFPGANTSKDGAVILYNAFGYDPTGSSGYNLKSYTNYNVTAIHEVGHGLSLYHTFQGDDGDLDGTADQCPVDTDPTTDGDKCTDTDAHRRDDSNCDVIQPTCHGVTGSVVYNNFMAYSNDDCQDRFTSEQKDRMRATLETSRASLVTSLALTPPPASVPNTIAIDCSPVTASIGLSGGYGGIMEVKFGNRTVSTSYSADDDATYNTDGYLDFSAECLYYEEFDEGETFDVQVETWYNAHNIKVYVDWNNSGTFDAGEQELNLSTTGTAGGGSDIATGQITIPAGVTLNQFIRLRFNADIGTVNSACEGPAYGQVEDYAIYVRSSACADPEIPVVTNSSGVICEGEDAVLDISGNLNDAAYWAIYTGSCGGTLLGTTATSSFTVTPASPSTVYFVRGEGGCVTPGTCGSATIFITTADNASYSYSSSAYCVSGSDPTPTITGLAGGTFSSTPSGLSINAATGLIDLSASSSNSYTVTYTTNGSCPSSSNQPVTINSVDDASYSYGASSYCVNGTDPTPTITGLAGGTFSSSPSGLSINTSTGVIDLSASSSNSYTVTYTTNGPCPSSSNQSVVINNVDDASFNYSASSYCVNGTDPTPTILGLAGGTFSSTPGGLSMNSSSGQIDLSASTSNTYSVTYTTAGTCSNSSSVNVTVNSLDNATFSYGATSYCQDDANPLPSVTGLTGGTFSSSPTGLSLNSVTGEVNLASSNINNYTISYSTSGVCPNASSVAFEVKNCNLPTTQLKSSFCNTTLSSFSTYFSVDPVGGASAFRLRFEDQSNPGNYLYKTLNSYGTTLNGMGITSVSTTYNVQVQVYIGGQWGPYGPVCTLTTPPTLSTTQLKAAFCNSSMNSFSDVFSVDAVAGATKYQLRFEDQSSPGTYIVKTLNSYGTSLNGMGITSVSTTYNVQVRIYINGLWGPFGPVCTLTTPSSLSTTQLKPEYCNITLSSFTSPFSVIAVGGATAYNLRFEDVSNPGSYIYKTLNSYGTTLNGMGITSLSTTYNVQVKAYVNGVWGPYGPICTLTTPSSQAIAANNNGQLALEKMIINDFGSGITEETNLELINVYPNPFKGQLTIDMSGIENKDGTITIYSTTGQMVMHRSIDDQIMLLSLENLESGIYMLQINQGDQMKMIKLLKE